MAATDLITFDELRASLTELEDTRSIAKRELETLRTHRERIGGLEANRDTLLDSLVGVAPDALKQLTPEERHHVLQDAKAKSNRRLRRGPGGQRGIRRRLCYV